MCDETHVWKPTSCIFMRRLSLREAKYVFKKANVMGNSSCVAVCCMHV